MQVFIGTSEELCALPGSHALYDTLESKVLLHDMKVANLQSRGTERMMVRKMCGVSLKASNRNVNLFSVLGVESVTEVVRRGRLRWFGHG